jgi:uncharacterized OB-fold protein
VDVAGFSTARQPETRVLAPELIHLPDRDGSGLALNGSRCGQCARFFFPPQGRCCICESTNVGPAQIGQKGTIYSYTICHFTPPGGKYKGYIPYGLGLVALKEGIMIPARLMVEAATPLRVGLAVELCLDSWRDPDSKGELVSFAYRPARG